MGSSMGESWNMSQEALSHPNGRLLCGLSKAFASLLLGSTPGKISVFSEGVPKFLTVPMYMLLF